MADDGPWYALGDGETFEDMIFNTLVGCGRIRCSECGEEVTKVDLRRLIDHAGRLLKWLEMAATV